MEGMKKFFIHNFKFILLISLCIQIGLYIYCYPVSKELYIDTYMNIIFYCTFFIIILGIANQKIPVSTGVYNSIKKYYRFCYFLILLLSIFIIIGLIFALATKDIKNACTIVPTVVGLYCTIKAEYYFNLNVEEELKESSTSESFINYFIVNFKKLMLCAIIISVICFVICLPMKTSELVEILVAMISLSLMMFLLPVVAKINNSTGTTEVFSKFIPLKYAFYFIPFSLLFVGFLGVVICLWNRECGAVALLIPGIIGINCASKAAQISQKGLDETSKGGY